MELADDGGVLLSVETAASKLCDNDDSPAIVCELLGVDEDPGSKSDKIDPIPPGDDEDGVADDGALDEIELLLGEVGLLLGVLEVVGLVASGADDSSSQSSSSSASGAADCAVAGEAVPATVLATAVVGADAAAADDDDAAAAAGELAAAEAVLPVIPFTKSLKKFLFSCCCIPSALAKAIKATQIEVNVDTFIFLTLSISDL